ncbi:MAG TPA: SIMPL domain-containing protein [Longimicrobiales bacterium]|nr:SIMPL domain-containing protein [Longimicrobiales bacterium]
MNRLTCVLIAASLTACSSLPAPAAAQVPAQDSKPRTLHVNATASVQRAPDRAVISLGVETVATTAAQASSRNAEAMDAVLRAIRGLGIDESRIQTRRVELQPRYDRSRDNTEPRITGYVATNQVVVTVDDIGLVGRVVDAGVAAGANRVNGISFELRDQESAYHDALREAIAQARREAEVAAAALGESLGPVLNVSTGGYQPMYRTPPAPQMEMRMDMAQAVPTPVQPGELDVHASVNITFRIGT